MTGRSQSVDMLHVYEHVHHALTLISHNDDGNSRASEWDERSGYKTQITPVSASWYRVRVIDAEPWKSGRPERGEPRYYDVTVTITPRVTLTDASEATS